MCQGERVGWSNIGGWTKQSFRIGGNPGKSSAVLSYHTVSDRLLSEYTPFKAVYCLWTLLLL